MYHKIKEKLNGSIDDKDKSNKISGQSNTVDDDDLESDYG